MEFTTPSIEQILHTLRFPSRPPSHFTVDERRIILEFLDQARTPLAGEYAAWVHVFTAEAGIDPRLTVLPLPLHAHRRGRAIFSDPSLGMLFGSFWSAGDSTPERELADMAAAAPDQSLIVVRDKTALAGQPVDMEPAAPSVWDSLARGVSWAVLPSPSPDVGGPGLFAALGKTARRRNLDLPVYRHHVRRCPEQAERDSGFPRWVRGLYVEMTLADARSRKVLSRRALPVPAYKAISGSIFFDEFVGGP